MVMASLAGELRTFCKTNKNGENMLTDKTLKIGRGNISLVYDILKENNISGKLLYVSDHNVDRLYGSIVKQQLSRIGRVKEELVELNTIEYALNVAEIVLATDVGCIVALGGGRVMDVCKYAAYVSKCPILAIPTTMANDGIASPIAVLKRQDNKPKSLGCAIPTMLLVDTQLIMDSPIELIKAGIGDTISNYMALKDWEFACEKGRDKMNGYAYIMSKTALDALIRTQYNEISYDFIEVLANSLVLSGLAMDFANSSRPVSGSEHLFSHALDYYCPAKNLHGIQVALGTVSMLKITGQRYDFILDYLKKFKVEINPEKLEITEEDFITCVKNATAMRSNRYTYLNEMELSDEMLKKVYKELVEEL